MALIEYDIEYVNGQVSVTVKVVEVDKGDRIQFKSKDADAAIRYTKKGSPFSSPDAPQADVVFKIGHGRKGPFTVVQHLTHENRLHFDCGELKKAVAVGGSAFERAPGSGFGTPND